MKFLVLFLLVLNSYAGGGKPIAPNCDQIVEEMDDSALLVALLVKMHEERVISEEDLERFYVNLSEGKLVNPIPLKKGPYGPVITSAKELVFYKAFQNLVEFSNKIEYQVVAQQLKKIHQNLEKIKVEKTIVRDETNKDFKLNAVIYESDINYLLSFSKTILVETDITKSYRYGLDVLKKYLLESSDEQLNVDGFRIKYALSPNENFDVLMNKVRTNPSFKYTFFPLNKDLFFNLSSENLEKYAIELMEITNDESFIVRMLNKIGAKASDQLIKEVKERILSHTEQKLFVYLYDYLDFFKNHFPDQLQGLIQEVKKRSAGNTRAKVKILKIQYAIDQNYEEFEKSLLTSKDALNEMFFLDDFHHLVMQRKDMVRLFKLGLEDSSENISDAIFVLGHFRSLHYDDKETLPLVRAIWTEPLYAEVQTVDKIKTLTGVDEEWAHEIIKKIHNDSFSGTELYEKSAAALTGQKSRKSRDAIDEVFGHYGQFATYADPKVAADFLKGRSKADLYYFIEKYQFKNINFYGGAIERLFFDFNEKNKKYVKMALTAIKDRKVSSDFAKKFLTSLPKNESIQFLHEWIKSEMSRPGAIYITNSLPIYLLSMMDFSPETFAYADWQVRNAYDPKNRTFDLYLSLFFQAFDKLSSNDPAEVDLAKKIIKEFDPKLILK